MPQRSLLALAASLMVAAIFLVRHHLRDPFEVARTYATFYPHLDRHQDILYSYPGTSQRASAKHHDELIPPLIHRIFLTEGRDASLSEYEEAISSCQLLHPTWTHHLWTDQNATEFMTRHYSKILKHYLGYKQTVQRANVLRYALLEHYGGVYLDIDVTCLQPLDELRTLPFLTPGAYPAGVNNAFVLSRPQHKFLHFLRGGIESRDLRWGMPYIENMLSTGCMFFSNRWMGYARSLAQRREGDISPEERTYILADEAGNLDPHMLRGAVTTPLFKHAGASSWHGWDAVAIVMIGRHYYYFLAMMGLGAVSTAVSLWKFTRRRPMQWTGLIDSGSGRNSVEQVDDMESLVGRKEG